MKSPSTRKFVSTREEMPTTPHFAIIDFDSIYIEGDERSKSCPGHGYPAHTENIVRYVAYMDEQEWKAAIEEKMTAKFGRTDNFFAIRVTPANIKTRVEVSVG